MKTLLLLVVLALVILTGGCASILKGTNDRVYFCSSPSGASVYVDGAKIGITKVCYENYEDGKNVRFGLSQELVCSKSHLVEFRKEGYYSKQAFLNPQVGGDWIILDILCGLLPVLVDASTGAWNSLDPYLRVDLEKKETARKEEK